MRNVYRSVVELLATCPGTCWPRAMAVVVTYCRRSPHDRYFFDEPLRILGAVIEAPTFNLRNPLMVAKHIRSATLSRCLLRSRRDRGEPSASRACSKSLFPTFIEATCSTKMTGFEIDRRAARPSLSFLVK